MKKLLSFTALASVAFALFTARAEEAKDGFISLFNGKDLTGWKANDEDPKAFSVQDGALHIKGGRAPFSTLATSMAASSATLSSKPR